VQLHQLQTAVTLARRTTGLLQDRDIQVSLSQTRYRHTSNAETLRTLDYMTSLILLSQLLYVTSLILLTQLIKLAEFISYKYELLFSCTDHR
jgi:hypothetical protein